MVQLHNNQHLSYLISKLGCSIVARSSIERERGERNRGKEREREREILGLYIISVDVFIKEMQVRDTVDISIE